jgi:triosephosphate isomerase
MPLFIANWKMHKTREEARVFSQELGGLLRVVPVETELVIVPPFTALDAALDARGRWWLAAQNVAAEPHGAYTGEVSARMLRDAGCAYAIVGHSERRRLFREDGPVLAKKLARLREERLIPIYCVGETEEERLAGRTESVLTEQIETLQADPDGSPLIVAYEPVWAIGTGQAATPEDAREGRILLAERLARRASVRLLYGGSVGPDNARELLEVSGMDGFLVGGASLDPRKFAAIAGLL